MLGCKPAKSPLRSKTVMSLRKEGEEKADQARYLAAVGSLMYAMLGTRPDLAYPVGLLGRFASDPSVTHWDGAPTPFAITVTPLAPAVSPASRSVAIASSFQARTCKPNKCFHCTLSKQKCSIDRALNKDEFDEQLLSPRFDFTMDMSSEDENMAIDQRADASDASVDHASVVCNTTAIVALDKAMLSLESTLKDLRATLSILLGPLSKLNNSDDHSNSSDSDASSVFNLGGPLARSA